MRKRLLLMAGAAALAVSASAATFEQGKAFAYTIDPSFSFELTAEEYGELYVQYPADALKGQASMEYGYGLASAWFNGKKFNTPAEANEYCPVVADPWDSSKFAVRMKTTAWDGFGNFNFALPEVNEPCRIRVIYRVDENDANEWYSEGDGKKPFHIKLMHNADQDAGGYPELTEDNALFWTNPGWRVADFVETLDGDMYYLSLLWDSAGLSCQRNVGFYVEEVSVVPLSQIPDYVAPEGNAGITVTTTFPDLVTFGQGGAPEGSYKQGEAFGYDIDPTFSWDLTAEAGEAYVQYPADAFKGQASLKDGFGYTSVWFNGKKFANSAEANEYCPLVEDPFNEGGYAVRMQTTNWDGFGNFNFALPQVGEPCRIRAIYRVDESAENAWYSEGDGKKPFHVKLMHHADQDAGDYPEVTEDNALFWTNPGWRIADFVDNLATDEYYLSILFDAGGLSCQRNVAFYLEEVSVVPLSLLPEYTAPAGDAGISVVTTMPELVKIDRTSGVESIATEAKAKVYGTNGAVVVNGFEGAVEVYNMMGMLVAKTNVKGNATVAVPAGIAIVKAGNSVAKVVVR